MTVSYTHLDVYKRQVYVDTNKMSGRSISYAQANQQNHFLPMPDPHLTADIIYLCSPNNPTGAAYSRQQMKEMCIRDSSYTHQFFFLGVVGGVLFNGLQDLGQFAAQEHGYNGGRRLVGPQTMVVPRRRGRQAQHILEMCIRDSPRGG